MRTPPRRAATATGVPSTTVGAKGPSSGQTPTLSRDSELAGAIKALVVAGDREVARERFAELVARQQRRAVRIAYHYLRDAHDADEAVQDAFVKVFTHITTYREDLPFEVWFTRILVNGCLDLRKSRARRLRWVLPIASSSDAPPPEPVSPQRSVEDLLLSSERGRQISAAVEQLPDRQRTVFTLCHMAEQSTSEVSRALGLSEATVRVHLFRAVRKLRKLLAPQDAGAQTVAARSDAASNDVTDNER
jgi:RNA polymerase sigma-70 factor (ECF subfamily)